MRGVTKQHALQIAKKLSAERTKGRNHDHYHIYHEGREVLSFGLSRTSSKDKLQLHICQQLELNAYQVRRLASCELGVKELFELWREKGKLGG